MSNHVDAPRVKRLKKKKCHLDSEANANGP